MAGAVIARMIGVHKCLYNVPAVPSSYKTSPASRPSPFSPTPSSSHPSRSPPALLAWLVVKDKEPALLPYDAEPEPENSHTDFKTSLKSHVSASPSPACTGHRWHPQGPQWESPHPVEHVGEDRIRKYPPERALGSSPVSRSWRRRMWHPAPVERLHPCWPSICFCAAKIRRGHTPSVSLKYGHSVLIRWCRSIQCTVDPWTDAVDPVHRAMDLVHDFSFGKLIH
jgi:hypothetical protein